MNLQLLLATSWMPIAATSRRNRRMAVVIVTLMIGLSGVLLLYAAYQPPRDGTHDTLFSLSLTGQTASLSPASNVFVVNGTTVDDDGVATLITLMGAQGRRFYQSPTNGATQGPDGLFAADDVILIKVNSQWNQRGGTNTDVLTALLQALVDHPNGFTGEIVVADNGQAQFGSAGNGGSLDWAQSNAENHAQSVQDVVDTLASTDHVSTYLWDAITRRRVDEYDSGDLTDGYVVNATADAVTGLMVSYPKFRTLYGTYVSFTRGIWDPASETYDDARLKVINLPVLKSHGGYGVTAAVKHYMGVVSDQLTSDLGARAHDTIGNGGMGTELAGTRLPTLNLLDAIWVNAVPKHGPSAAYDEATRVNVLAASTDPVALDAWAAKHVLMQAAQRLGYTDRSSLDPEYTGQWSAFGNWLRRSQQALTRAGYTTTLNPAQINVYLRTLP
jgi:hypothetical protein